MTTIEYGGGPSLEQRRAFANLEEGGHVPGSSRPHSSIPYTPNSNYYSARIFHQEGMIPDYEGHIHGYQYHVGKNFGNTTRDLEIIGLKRLVGVPETCITLTV
ncbi:unnamed protein product [Schistosoma rodhaini]|uniref:Uncharacterized protein n=1 Tax=Schistosoma rodhaini TaxID=6188 RepID=A0AA85FMR0_9TREM|nr:unnamed protein product [Schistosoma rodhaini]